MSTSNAATRDDSYNVYIPDSHTYDIIPFDISTNVKVEKLKEKIRDHDDFKDFIKSQRFHLYLCGEELKDDYEECRKHIVEWFRRLRHGENEGKMPPASKMMQHFPNGPISAQLGKDKTIDIVAIPESLKKDILQDILPIGFQTDERIRQLLFLVDGEIGTVPWFSISLGNGFNPKEATIPEFIKHVVKMLRRAPDNNVFMVPGRNDSLMRILETNGVLTSAGDAIPYAGWYLEISHYFNALALPLARRDVDFTERRVHGAVLDLFERYWLNNVQGSECTFRQPLPFPLIAEERLGGHTRSYRKYWPMPDAVFLKRSFSRFLAEIDSHDNEEDKYRLQVQAACTLRLASQLRKDNTRDNEPFLMAAFFSRQWTIYRYFFFFNTERKISSVEERFQVKEPDQLMEFLHEFYNYSRYVQDSNWLDDEQQEVEGICKKIVGGIGKSFYSTDVNKGGSRKRRRSEADQGPMRDANVGSTSYAAMVNALRESGYVVALGKDICDGFGPLVELPDNIIEATAPDGKLIVAKLPRRNSRKLSLLEELSSIPSPHNHVLPLLDTVQSSPGPLVILASEHPLSSDFLLEGPLKSKSVQLSRDLIEGMAFLHRRKIAHLDIKPDNLVYSFKSSKLYIIDFDIAMRCKDVDEMLEISCGTPKWSAPEIVHDDNEPLRAFSPIRADLWSCGKVLGHFAKLANMKDGAITLLMNSLMVSYPRRRPLLHEIVDEESDFWTSGRLLKALQHPSHIKAQEKRMAAGAGSKRTRGDCSDEGNECFASKVLRKVGAATARSSHSTYYASSLRSSPSSSNDSSLDTPFSSTLDLAEAPTRCKGDVDEEETRFRLINN